MNKASGYTISDNWIISKRGKKNSVNHERPYAWLVEKERTHSSAIEDTAVIFLTNKECPYRCLMCDLWKNTTDHPVSKGAIPSQIEWALAQLPPAKHIKLYNSGSFFDESAIPEEDYPQIAELVNGFETVIVESHARLIGDKCLRFRDMLKPELEVAIGLETANPAILRQLNKRMTLLDFEESVQFLTRHQIRSRAFILFPLPFLTESENLYWAKHSIDFAFKAGVSTCVVIPTRAGNGAMDLLMKNGDFRLPEITALEKILEYGIGLNAGNVFVDVWDLDKLPGCEKCKHKRIGRIDLMNLCQKIGAKTECDCITD
jgi:radical SAM enzyme (TIGR01210 family)